MTIKTVLAKRMAASDVARLFEVIEDSVQRYWNRTDPRPQWRVRRRVETPPSEQPQVDWVVFPDVVLGDEATDLVSLHMVLSQTRMEAVVWSRRKDLLSWLHCHRESFRHLGGVTVTVRVDNAKTNIVRCVRAWGTIRVSGLLCVRHTMSTYRRQYAQASQEGAEGQRSRAGGDIGQDPVGVA